MRVSLKTLIDRSIKNMGAVHSVVLNKALELVRQAYAEGINVQISSGFRSFEDQAYQYGKGRSNYRYNGVDYSKPGMSIVSHAKPGQSVHNYGLAIDYFLTTWDGSEATWSVNDNWCRVAEIGKSMGFSWGGDWSSFKDYPHLELTGGLTWYDLSQGERPTHLLADYLEEGMSGSKVKQLQNRLIDIGYDLGKYGADGDYGPTTKRAVMAFQKDYGLAVDGIYGDRTESKLVEVENMREFEEAPKSIAEEWKRAYELGLTDGAEPNESPTRAQVAAMIVRALDKK
ncbi:MULTISPECIES: peptidoglycan-binding protein [Pontibacillus]|uniref:M15 family metallopeptidase n=1 Tax=Pontibacillus chungwhensis TaxID=265426 RepID=A0ABY8V002_9BACI|nr:MULTISPECIES: peptidoglycan-binding protein [Pontibacillus]MCD5324799.1 M15 family metallopeptidase [Pontibacillus sp. HN14]WIF98758.1 M15 family metallopeptidase [Pontibacillus chungwhensis]